MLDRRGPLLVAFLSCWACRGLPDSPGAGEFSGGSESETMEGSSEADVPTGLNAEDDVYTVFQFHDEALITIGTHGLLDNDTASSDAEARSVSDATMQGWWHTIEKDGTFSYERDPSFWGLDGFRYLLVEPDGNSRLADVSLLVRPERILLDDVRAKGYGSFIVTGEGIGDELGASIAGVGDFNGDGIDDIAVGAPSFIANGQNAGRCYVIFGTTEPKSLDLRKLTEYDLGFVLNGEGLLDRACHSVAGLGDLNGDGRNELIIGAPNAGANHGGRVYVVFGQPGAGSIELSDIEGGSGGFVIESESPQDDLGWVVAPAGDVNGDERPDILVTARNGHDAVKGSTGRAYVVLGTDDSSNVSLSEVVRGFGGFAIIGETFGDQLGVSAVGAVDVNGDGLDDVILGAPRAIDNAGRVYVVFSKPDDLSSISLDSIPPGRGFVINGAHAYDGTGISVAALRDANGDGFDEVIVGVKREALGSAYVVYGKTDDDPVLLEDLDAGSNSGYRVKATEPGDLAGSVVATIGDFDGNEIEDFVVGAPLADSPVDGSDVGSAHIIYGTVSPAADVSLSNEPDGNEGFVVVGEAGLNTASFVVSGAGDYNGDGLDDLLVGSTSWATTGTVYVIFGVPSQAP